MADENDFDPDGLTDEWQLALDEQTNNEMDSDMARQWEAMLNEDQGNESDGMSTVERLLDQEEIDSIFGFTADQDVKNQDGIRALINSASISYERLPMLEIVFDRFIRLMTTSLRSFTSYNVDVSVDVMSSVRFGDYLDSIPLPAILSVFKVHEWNNYGLLMTDSNLLYSIVDVLLGGRTRIDAASIDGRPYTTIEMNLIKRMVDVVLSDAQQAFLPIAPVVFDLERMETNPRFAAISRPSDAAVLVRLRIDMEGRGGHMEMLLPYATIEPIRGLLLQMFMGEKFGRDPIWESHLATELWNAEVSIDVVLHELSLPLHRVMDIKLGETLMFDVAPKDPVVLRCGDVHLTQGHMGRHGDHVAVNVSRELIKPKMTLSAFENADALRMEDS